jgi:hypothetical protein
VLDGVPGIVKVRFNEGDVVRHPLVAEIVGPMTAPAVRRRQAGSGFEPVGNGMRPPFLVDLSVEAGDWPPEEELAAIVARAAEATVAELVLPPDGCELSVVSPMTTISRR